MPPVPQVVKSISEADHDVLRQMIHWWKNRNQGDGREDEPDAPPADTETYLAKPYTAIAGANPDNDRVSSNQYCDIYKMIPSGSVWESEKQHWIEDRIFNPGQRAWLASASDPGESMLWIQRDRYGRWFVPPLPVDYDHAHPTEQVSAGSITSTAVDICLTRGWPTRVGTPSSVREISPVWDEFGSGCIPGEKLIVTTFPRTGEKQFRLANWFRFAKANETIEGGSGGSVSIWLTTGSDSGYDISASYFWAHSGTTISSGDELILWFNMQSRSWVIVGRGCS